MVHPFDPSTTFILMLYKKKLEQSRCISKVDLFRGSEYLCSACLLAEPLLKWSLSHLWVCDYMTHLGSVTDGIHDHVMLLQVARPVLLHHGALKQLPYGCGLIPQHSRLICKADSHQILLRIKPL